MESHFTAWLEWSSGLTRSRSRPSARACRALREYRDTLRHIARDESPTRHASSRQLSEDQSRSRHTREHHTGFLLEPTKTAGSQTPGAVTTLPTPAPVLNRHRLGAHGASRRTAHVHRQTATRCRPDRFRGTRPARARRPESYRPRYRCPPAVPATAAPHSSPRQNQRTPRPSANASRRLTDRQGASRAAHPIGEQGIQIAESARVDRQRTTTADSEHAVAPAIANDD